MSSRGLEGGRACRGHRGGEGCSRSTAGSGRILSLLSELHLRHVKAKCFGNPVVPLLWLSIGSTRFF